MRVINCHAHFHDAEEVERSRPLWDSLGYVKVCMSGIGGHNNDVRQLMARYPGYILGFYHFNLDDEKADGVARARARGFTGLKFLGARYPYSEERYFPVYRRAEELGMPALFHTGVLDFGFAPPGFRQEHPQPSTLITIANRFPAFRLLGAHLGTQWPIDAVTALGEPNIWFDISGGTLRYYPAAWFRWLFERVERNQIDQTPRIDPELVGKLVFGSDNPDDTMDFYRNLLRALEIPPEIQQKIYYDNAAQWLGLAAEGD
jgi:uncharacterized protein